jgi:hypothetical protein
MVSSFWSYSGYLINTNIMVYLSLLIIAYTYLSFCFSSMLPLKTWNQGMSLMRVLAQFVIGNFGCFEIAIGL